MFSSQWKDGDSDNIELSIVPGLGVRYSFWEDKNIDVYTFGIYSFPITRYNGEPAYFQSSALDLGLGGVYKLNQNFALIGETGLQRMQWKNSNWREEGIEWVSTSSIGLRFYF